VNAADANLTLRTSLSKTIHWFRPFEQNFEARVAKAVTERPLPWVDYDPLLIEQLLRDAVALIERCLVYRKDGMELDVLAIRAAAEYSKFLQTVPIDERMQVLSFSASRHATDTAGHGRTAAAFSKVTGDPISTGFASQFVESSTGSSESHRAAQELERLAVQRWAVERDYAAKFHERHQEPGNSHNYAERTERIIRYMAEDLQECYAKASALLTGVAAVYGRQYEIPTPATLGALDEYVSVLRSLGRFIETESLTDTSWSVVVPLVQTYSLVGNKAARLMRKEEFNELVDSGRPIAVDLSPLFMNLRCIRLASVGLSYVRPLPSESIAQVSSFRLNARVEPPSLPATGYKTRPPILFGNVSAFGGTAGLDQTSLNCRNIDPRGVWRIKLSPNFLDASIDDEEVKSGFLSRRILDLRLHLGLTSKAESPS
jgi:hypothetical protein